jgi:hypothetical protein
MLSQQNLLVLATFFRLKAFS